MPRAKRGFGPLAAPTVMSEPDVARVSANTINLKGTEIMRVSPPDMRKGSAPVSRRTAMWFSRLCMVDSKRDRSPSLFDEFASAPGGDVPRDSETALRGQMHQTANAGKEWELMLLVSGEPSRVGMLYRVRRASARSLGREESPCCEQQAPGQCRTWRI